MIGHKKQRMASAFVNYFRQIPQRWRWISQSHRTSNRWWNLGFVCECWKQSAVKALGARTLTKQTEKFKQTLSACQKADGNSFLGWERSADSGIYATRDLSNVRSAMRNTKKLRKAIQIKKAWNAAIRCSAPQWQRASAYSCLHSNTVIALQLAIIWPTSLQPCSRSEQHVYLLEEMVGITELQSYRETDGRCRNVAELTGDRGI
jgi:hypothetical protein